jgi:hypothetical protein
MIACGICGADNDDFATVCKSCRSFLQAKVDTLDLFSTLWGLMESPLRTFRRIVLARHKNYVLPLSALSGVSVVYNVLWLGNFGMRFQGLGQLLLFGFVAGVVLGITSMLLLSLLLMLGGKILGGRGTFRGQFGANAYAFSPMAVFLLVTLPMETGIFGIYFFDHNPSPYVINPVSYVILCILHGIPVIASAILLTLASKVVHSFSIGRGILSTLLVGAIAGGIIYGIRAL